MSETFHVINPITKQQHRCIQKDENTFFVFAPRARTRGWRYTRTEFEQRFCIKPSPSENDQWHHRIKRCLNILQTSGLWGELIPFFKTLSKMNYDDLKEMQKEYWEENRKDAPASRFADKYPFAYKPYHNGILLDSEYLSELTECRLKSMYFGKGCNKDIKNRLQECIQNRTSYQNFRTVNYDVRIEYDADRQKAWYAEEFRNCGNGHYYLAIDHNTALFCEND